MKILLIGNYLIDRQESMQRFTNMLAAGLVNLGHEVRVIRPEPFWIKLASNFAGGLAKWFGYVDKFLAFPIALKQAIAWAEVVHICDHSNAFYTKYLQHVPHLVTCHDLAAVRGAMGEDTDCPVSTTGKILQSWILNGLKQAQLVVCDSSHTKKDLERLAGGQMAQRSKLLLLGLNHTYGQISAAAIAQRLQAFPQLDLSQPYLLNVGSSLRRKNREGVLQTFKLVCTKLAAQAPDSDYLNYADDANAPEILGSLDQPDNSIAPITNPNPQQMQLVFAGSPLTAEQEQLAQELNLSDRIVQIIKPDNNQLEALYNQAFALLFPSKFEGFGWPVIEAQACGCPVLCSDRTSLPEVAGSGAILRDADDAAGFADAVLEIFNHAQKRQNLVSLGFANIKRFEPAIMIQKYADIYAELLHH
ncbi:glycosyl transferase group 1 [Thalassoporum mexicanum PCC 7367]|uniref:glycosyltransferase n=1 Tax=Thalassoporum mexicanum TaxID=3457544 RepID=UPI00029FDD53|nr:glycosyltransferase [Pseudanabaena sp. PCC 7367]AFY70141.1 glycosyl transferase group 1 [Pseudanabaena sp. PCC 7367]